MRRRALGLVLVATIAGAAWGQRPWQQLSDPTVEEVAARFASPPAEYSMTFYWGWDGPVTEEVIARDLDQYKANNVLCVTVEPGYNMAAKYLSEDWFKLMKLTVEQARRRDMRVWIVDEGKYPSGFAGGKFSEQRPELRMQTFRIAEQFAAEPGRAVTRDLAPSTICVLAVNEADGTAKVLDTPNGKLSWIAPAGKWQVQIVEQQFRTSATRSVNNPKVGAKDATHSLCDYLNPEAVRQFIAWTHEQYKPWVGDEFGKTVLGFRGDEPDYGIVPWTGGIVEEFQKRKGYDVRPYLPAFIARRGTVLTDAQKRASADYWDVWSSLFEASFFKQQGDWCAANNLEYLVHPNHEDQMVSLARSEGDYFRCMRSVQMPGVDAIWDQIWPDKVSDFPKYASSAAHLFGRPRAFTESFAAYKPAPNANQAEWILNQQLVRGLNMVEVMWIPASTSGNSGMRGWLADRRFPAIAKYLNRVCYVLSQGRPTAKIALYHPTMSLWLGDAEANNSTLSVMQQLLEHQRDFDVVDDRSIGSVLKLEGKELRNLSGQGYAAVIVPSVTAMSQAALDQLKAFAAAGGKVVFLGRTPTMVIDTAFLSAGAPADLGWAMHEPSGKLTDAVLAALPDPDVALHQPCPAIKYTHRRLKNADVYFFFNEAAQPQSCKATLAGGAQVQSWNATTGAVERLEGTSVGSGRVSVNLPLAPWGTRLLVIRQ